MCNIWFCHHSYNTIDKKNNISFHQSDVEQFSKYDMSKYVKHVNPIQPRLFRDCSGLGEHICFGQIFDR